MAYATSNLKGSAVLLSTLLGKTIFKFSIYLANTYRVIISTNDRISRQKDICFIQRWSLFINIPCNICFNEFFYRLHLLIELSLEAQDYSFLCFVTKQLDIISFVYRSPSFHICSILDIIADSIENTLSLYTTANYGVVNAHHHRWLNYFEAASVQTLNVSIVQSPSQIEVLPTRVPSQNEQHASLLDLFLSSSVCSFATLPSW